MNHVGMLETSLSTISPNTQTIEDGEAEASDILNEIPHEVMDEDPEEGMHY